MNLSSNQSAHIVAVAKNYIGHSFDYQTFNCVHFVREVYRLNGITLPRLYPFDYPPSDLHLSREELVLMPLGHTVFLKRKGEQTSRSWTHVALVYSTQEFIHCSRYLGHGVNVVTVEQMFSVYSLTTKPS